MLLLQYSNCLYSKYFVLYLKKKLESYISNKKSKTIKPLAL